MIERSDLSSNYLEYESTWIEIKNKRVTDITATVIDNIFSLLCSLGLLPRVLQPTRVTDNAATVIDNIFSNNIQDNIVSGNILLTLSGHFSQFLSFTREKVDLKKVDIYQRDYSNFSSDSFRDDDSIQNWNYSHDNVHDFISGFYTKLDGSVNRHAPF